MKVVSPCPEPTPVIVARLPGLDAVLLNNVQLARPLGQWSAASGRLRVSCRSGALVAESTCIGMMPQQPGGARRNNETVGENRGSYEHERPFQDERRLRGLRAVARAGRRARPEGKAGSGA